MATLTIRLTESEIQLLKAYCKRVHRTQTDVLRGFIRNLEDTHG